MAKKMSAEVLMSSAWENYQATRELLSEIEIIPTDPTARIEWMIENYQSVYKALSIAIEKFSDEINISWHRDSRKRGWENETAEVVVSWGSTIHIPISLRFLESKGLDTRTKLIMNKKRNISQDLKQQFLGCSIWDKTADELARAEKEALIDGKMPQYSFSLSDLFTLTNIKHVFADNPVGIVYAVDQAFQRLTCDVDYLQEEIIHQIPEFWLNSTHERAERWFETLSHPDFPVPSSGDSDRWALSNYQSLRETVTDAWIGRSKKIWERIVKLAAERNPELYARFELASLKSYRDYQFFVTGVTGQNYCEIRPATAHQAIFGGAGRAASRDSNPTSIKNIPGAFVAWYIHSFGELGGYETICTIYYPDNWEGAEQEAQNWVDYVDSVKLELEPIAAGQVKPEDCVKKPSYTSGYYWEVYEKAVKWLSDTQFISLAKGEQLPLRQGEKRRPLDYR